MKIEEHPGSITIETPEGKLCLTTEESWELLEWLYTHRGKLFAFAHHLQSASQAQRETPKGEDLAPARADKISYQEAQRLGICPYCGEPGEPAHFEIDVDPDFERYTCPNNHSFFVERKRS